MTSGYMAPELFTDRGICLQPTMTSDIYFFGMLTYEVIFQQEPWLNVSMQIINAVRSGFRPVIPDNSPQFITKITELCWQHDYNLRPCASEVLQMLEEAMKALDSVLNSSALPEISHGSDTFCDIDYAPSYSTSKSFGTTVVSHQLSSSVPPTDNQSNSNMNLCSSIMPNASDNSNLTPAENQLHSSISHDSTWSYLGTSSCYEEDSTVLGVSNASAALRSSNTSDVQFMETQSSDSALQLTQTQSSAIVLNASQVSMASHLDNGNSPSYCMEVAKSTLKIKEFKRFQVDCISAITQRKDVIVV